MINLIEKILNEVHNESTIEISNFVEESSFLPWND